MKRKYYDEFILRFCGVPHDPSSRALSLKEPARPVVLLRRDLTDTDSLIRFFLQFSCRHSP